MVDRNVQPEEQVMTQLDQVKVTPRDQHGLNLLVQGGRNNESGSALNISPRTVKQHLHRLFCRARIFDGRKRVKLARYFYEGEAAVMHAMQRSQPNGKSDFDSSLGRPNQSRNRQNHRHQRTND